MRKTGQRTILILFLFVFFLQGCASTQQRRDVVESGFLTANEHAMITEGKKNEALLRYIIQMSTGARWTR